MTDNYDDDSYLFSPTIATTLDIVHLCNNDAKLISEIPPTFGNFRVKPVKALLFPIPTESTLLYDTKRFTYFEVVLRTKLEKLYIGFGFTARENHTEEDIVGWSTDSIGFHFDNGRVYQETSFTTRIIEKVYLVDVVGDEVFGFMIDHEIGEFKVTRNGTLLENALGNRFTKERYKEKIFKPMVSLNCKDVEMEVNLGLDLVRRPFMFWDILNVKQRGALFRMGSKCSDIIV